MKILVKYGTITYLIDKLVLLQTTDDLYYFQNQIHESISNEKAIVSKVLVDLILRNGYSFNRFCLLQFGKDKIVKTYIVNPREVPSEIKSSIKNYLKENFTLLEQSSLSKSSIDFILN